MKQNYYFLVDRSNSIDKHRYQTFKRAVSKALISLHQGDSFNIIVFDNKISKLSERPLPYSKKAVQLAEEFLEKEPHGSYFAATDIYSALSNIVPSDISDEEVNTAILISDGDSQLHPEKQRKLIQSWLEKNSGRVSLFTACVGDGNNKTMLDLLSSMSRGTMLYADTHTSFPRKLAKMVIDLRFPIAKDLMMTIVKADPSSKLKLYPASSFLPSLFSNHPYIIFGSAEKLSDFTLLLEGRNKNRVLSIQKQISFAKAKEDSRFLAQKWKTTQAHQYYEEYMQGGQISLLQKAEALFKSDKPTKTPKTAFNDKVRDYLLNQDRR
jgi:Ca-activated chloride channel family protein